mmetsp:Transcript_13619/g.23946  ORF Transcript_13619/g.23946 Transcript_13619/m.23946 type:complete len:293 (+) Transcript_13619:126-1004(+)|eukprot:CAMPEP_0119103216 /NCGR_PEP_ID=MMETSP1180-20130426/1709_1 /TAXON_ID=3052 ORGANISM="Chlamydomonas cf sp, Strain CCMP681" /NCGR_SAMPLE_ID=MMETSP1180 /ASSEMBLY_ACC=CAM_ASM_000741 /LENGTH=292 /DNA_ID=CAMNT_0007087663 /DNA_START=124 /DNA_END=1002 /DNA_ORIENTATION=+
MAASIKAPLSGAVLYSNALAFYPGRVSLMLAEKGLSVKTVNVDILASGALAPAYMRINPSSSVPSLQLPDKILTESLDICRYLDNIDGQPLGGDKVDRDLAEKFVQELEALNGNSYAATVMPEGVINVLKEMTAYKKKFAEARVKDTPDLAEAYKEKIASMGAMVEARDPAKAAQIKAQLKKVLDMAELHLELPPKIEGEVVIDKERTLFLAGSAYSLPDALLSTLLYRIVDLSQHKQEIAPRPALNAYMRRVRERPSWNAAFGVASSTWGKVSGFVPSLVKVKIGTLFHRY